MFDLTTRPQTEILPPLSDSQKADRDRLDREMDANEGAVYDYIRALWQYRDQKLYREKYTTFDSYLADRRKKFTRQRVSQLIAFVQTIDSLAEQADVEVLPESERQTRAMNGVTDPVEKAAVWLGAQVASGQEQPDAVWVKGSVQTLQQVKDTGGYVDTGNGRMTAFTAGIIQATADLKARQRDYVEGGQSGKRLAKVEGQFLTRGEDPETCDQVTLRIADLTEETWKALAEGGQVVCYVYPANKAGTRDHPAH